MSRLCATDLDRTLIYSTAAIQRWGCAGEVVAVERYREADASFMTADAAEHFEALTRDSMVVPVTTRTTTQLARVRLPGPPPRWAIAANGGVLLENGTPDASWAAAVVRVLRDAAPLEQLDEHARAVCRPEWTSSVRSAQGLFCYAVLDVDALPADFVAEQRADAEARGWTVSLQGRKLYWVPIALTKSAAVAEVARRAGSTTVFAAGDSLLDADLLETADAGILARHGELAASGWRSRNVQLTERSGIEAGAEIVSWFTRRLAELHRPAS